MIKRRLYRQGNSIVVAFPSYMLEALELQPGDRVYFSLNLPGQTVKITPIKEDVPIKKGPAKPR